MVLGSSKRRWLNAASPEQARRHWKEWDAAHPPKPPGLLARLLAYVWVVAVVVIILQALWSWLAKLI
jgi:hypothetical protein